MKKSIYVLLLLALVLFGTSACSKSANPTSPSPVTPIGGGGGVAANASVASWAIFPSSACNNGPFCDPGQAIRPNSEGRYELAYGTGNYIAQVIYNNPQVPGRVVQYRRLAAFSAPEMTEWRQFRQTDPGTPTQFPVQLDVNVVYPKNAPDPVVKIESTESGPGLDAVRQIATVEIPIKLTNVS